MTAEQIILRPHTTERSYMDAAEGRYTFVVARNATKIDIRNAVEKLFSVKVVSVNTMNLLGKKKRVGVHQGKTSDWKKAIVKIDTNPEGAKYTTKGGKTVVNKERKYKSSIEEFGAVQ